jgi:Spx/MgsR family transcriptional regulator
VESFAALNLLQASGAHLRVLLLSSTGFEVPEGARSVLIVYGIPSCDTIRAACKWLQGRGIAFDLHDVRKDHLDSRTLEHWLDTLGRDRLINKSSATWRTLDISQREQVERGNPVPVIIANPTLMRRPVLVGEQILHVGFNAQDYERLFATS